MDIEDLDSEDYSKKFSDFFEFKSVLGKGAFGTVISAINKSDKREYAVKVILKRNVAPSDWEKLRREAFILSELNHPNIVRFKDIMETEKRIFLVMEVVKGGPLSDLMESRFDKGEAFTDEQASIMIKSILSAVSHLHSKEIVHRDLKPENILVKDRDDLSSIKIADFGLSGQFGAEGFMKTFRQKCGTMIYMAPELALNMLYSKPVDIWSCGLIMYMLLSKGKHPLYEKKDTPDSYIKKLQNPKWIFGENFTLMAQNFFLKLMNSDPLIRYTAEDALKHPWITRNFDDEIPLGAHEVVTYFSMEQTFTRILKALYLTSHLGSLKGETMDMPSADYKNLVGKIFTEHSNQPKKASMGRKSFLIEYDSLQNLLGITTPTESTHKKSFFSNSHERKTDSNYASGKSSPASGYKSPVEENKSQGPNSGKKSPVEENKSQDPKEDGNTEHNSYKVKVQKIEHDDLPSLILTKENSEPGRRQFLKPFEMPYQQSNSDLNKTTNDAVRNKYEESLLTIQADLEATDTVFDISIIPKSARENPTHDSLIQKETYEENGFQSDTSRSPQKSLNQRVLKQHKGSVPALLSTKVENSEGASFISDESSDGGSADSHRSVPLKGEAQKITKKSPFFHSAQRVSGPKTPGASSNKNISILIKSPSNGGLLPSIKRKSKDNTLPQIISPKNFDSKKSHEKHISSGSIRSNSKSHFPSPVAPLTNQTIRPMFEVPEAKFFTPKNSSGRKTFDVIQNLRSVVGSNNKDSSNIPKSKRALTLKTDESTTNFF